MRPQDDIIPHYYYEQLVRMGKENLCQGHAVEGFGYVLPEVQVTGYKVSSNQNFYDIEITNNVVVVDPNKPDTIPFFIMEAKYDQIYRHHVNAITLKGKPKYLTYDSNRKNAVIRRKNATSPYPIISGDLLHRDEYPYATTLEGGLGASVEYVDAQQNRKHGKEIGSSAKTFRMRTGDVFHIILIPKGDEWQPLKQPIYVPESDRKKITFPHPNPVPSKTILTWGSILTAFAILGKVLDVASSRILLIVMPLDPCFYQYQRDKNGNIIPPST